MENWTTNKTTIERHQDDLKYIQTTLQDKPKVAALIRIILRHSEQTMEPVEITFPPQKTDSSEFLQTWIKKTKRKLAQLIEGLGEWEENVRMI